MIVSNMQYFKLCCSDIVTWHKDHKYYEEMSTKSEVVCTLLVCMSYINPCPIFHGFLLVFCC